MTAWRRTLYEGALPLRLETPDLPKRIEQGVLNKIVGVGRGARPRGQAAAGPALQRFEVSSKQKIQRGTVARVRAIEQYKCGLGVRRDGLRGDVLGPLGDSGFYPEGDDPSRGLFGGRVAVRYRHDKVNRRRMGAMERLMNAASLRRALIALTVGGSISSLFAAGPLPKDVPVISIVEDGASDVAPVLTIRSDAAGSYVNSKTLTSLIQGIGDWVLDSINPAKATRRIVLDFSQPVPGSGPNGADPIGLPPGAYAFRALAQCSTYGNSLLAFTAGQIKTCPLRIGFDAGTAHYAIIMNPTGGVNGPFPETNAATVTCIYPSTGSAPCSQWRFTPSATYIAPDLSVKYRNVARLLQFDSRNNVVADHGDFYMSFSILLEK